MGDQKNMHILQRSVAYILWRAYSLQMVHCDLKTSNILLKAKRDGAKIGDVGLSRSLSNSYLSQTANGYGTFHYAAPEVLTGSAKCSEKVS